MPITHPDTQEVFHTATRDHAIGVVHLIVEAIAGGLSGEGNRLRDGGEEFGHCDPLGEGEFLR